MGADECDSIRAVAGLGLNAELMVWSRMRSDDIALCADMGIHRIDLSMSVSDQQIRGKLSKNRDWVLQQIPTHVEQAWSWVWRYVSVVRTPPAPIRNSF